MTDHPITPPPELVQQWHNEWRDGTFIGLENYIATQAARWGADQELEACCKTIKNIWDDENVVTIADFLSRLLAARRPKQPSLKEQALEELRQIPIDPEAGIKTSALDTIRRALEQLDD